MPGLIQIKDEEQKNALNSWAKKGFRGSIIAGTGFGKSRCGVIAVGKLLAAKPEAQAIVLVPTTQLQEQFHEEFHKWGYEDCLDRVDILCYQSAYKLTGQTYEIAVADEVHMGLSVEYRKFFANNTCNKLLCMTATLPEEPEYKAKLHMLAPTIYHITLDDCVQLGLVYPYEIYCVPVTLTEAERADYQTINRSFVDAKVQLGEDAFYEASRIIKGGSSSPFLKKTAAQFYKAIRDRKKIVDFASNKIACFKHLVVNNLDQRIISFGGANAFTDTLCESVAPFALAYHSKKTKKQKEKALKDFREGTINVLCSTKALNQGFDVPDANIGIICGLTSKSLSMIQRVGRLIRFQEGKTSKVIVLYVANSQEEKWLKQSVKTLTNIKWVTTLKDIP